MPYEVTINKKFTYVKLYKIVKSVKGEQNKISKMLTNLTAKYLLKKKPSGDGDVI